MTETNSEDRVARITLEKAFSNFYPDAANAHVYPELTFLAADSFPQQMHSLFRFSGRLREEAIVTVAYYGRGHDSAELARLLTEHGSDKAHNHGYTPAYARIFAELGNKPLSILEIGLGTNAPAAICTMGPQGVPGASVRAFRDFLPNAQVYGADIDRNILFSEERIRTAYVDQLDPASFETMTEELGESRFDLIIDDGLHSPMANLNTLLFGLKAVKDGGYVVIEDIAAGPRLDIWQMVRNVLDPAVYSSVLLRGVTTAHLFVVHKKKT